MKQVALLLNGVIQVWCNLIAVFGPLITIAATVLCLAPGDYQMALGVFVGFAALFVVLYSVPKYTFRAFIRRMGIQLPLSYGHINGRITKHVRYHKLDDGGILVEETVE